MWGACQTEACLGIVFAAAVCDCCRMPLAAAVLRTAAAATAAAGLQQQLAVLHHYMHRVKCSREQ